MLQISVVGVVHRGNYTCRAVNRLPQDEAVIGTVESCAQLFVISKSVTPTVYSMGGGRGGVLADTAMLNLVP